MTVTEKIRVVSCGIGTQHLAGESDLNTFCGRRIEYDTHGTFSDKWDCQACRKALQKREAEAEGLR